MMKKQISPSEHQHLLTHCQFLSATIKQPYAICCFQNQFLYTGAASKYITLLALKENYCI